MDIIVDNTVFTNFALIKRENILCGDADSNGVVDIFDALMISEYDAGLVGSLRCGP